MGARGAVIRQARPARDTALRRPADPQPRAARPGAERARVGGEDWLVGSFFFPFSPLPSFSGDHRGRLALGLPPWLGLACAAGPKQTATVTVIQHVPSVGIPSACSTCLVAPASCAPYCRLGQRAAAPSHRDCRVSPSVAQYPASPLLSHSLRPRSPAASHGLVLFGCQSLVSHSRLSCRPGLRRPLVLSGNPNLGLSRVATDGPEPGFLPRSLETFSRPAFYDPLLVRRRSRDSPAHPIQPRPLRCSRAAPDNRLNLRFQSSASRPGHEPLSRAFVDQV